jgi:hypothetical protein
MCQVPIDKHKTILKQSIETVRISLSLNDSFQLNSTGLGLTCALIQLERLPREGCEHKLEVVRP